MSRKIFDEELECTMELEYDMEYNQKEIIELHALSVLVANAYNTSYRADPTSDNSFYLMEAFKNLRRCLPVDPNTGKRFGSSLAYEATRGGI